MKFQAKILEKKNLTHDVLYFVLSAPEEFTFQAGQFVTLMMTKNNITKPRSYSILSPPSKKGAIDLCLKYVDGGFASDIFLNAKVGDEFEARGPFGHFLFDAKEQEHWFIGTGTGMVPFYCMLAEHLSQHPGKKFHLFWGLRYKKDIFFEQELKALQKKHPNFSYLITLSQDDHTYTGRVQRHLGEDFSCQTFYICGLKELVLETKELLEKKGVSKNRIHFERYT